MRAAIFALLSFALLIGGLWLSRRPHPAQELLVHFTCDVHGRLVPCGCFSGQMGGLTRISSLIGHESPEDTLKVDVGNAIEGTADYQVLQYSYLLKGFAQMGYEAANLGYAEAQLSARQLREINASSPVTLLSANLKDQKDGAPIFEGYKIIRRGSWRIALVGVMDEHLPAEKLGEGLTIEPMSIALNRLLPDLEKKVDFIFLLAFADESRLHALAREFYEPQLILGGAVSQPAQQLEHENRSLILYTTNQSRALGTLELSLGSRGKFAKAAGEVALVHDHVPEDAQIRALSDQYRAEIRHTKLQVDDPSSQKGDFVPGVHAAAEYVGSESCIRCHANAAKVWQNTSHAGAFQALLKSSADADPNCVGCHTVGFGAPSGYRREFGGAKLADVGCESCHGPGSAHVAQHEPGADVTTHFRPLGAGDCEKCHHGEFSRPFDWNEFWPRIQHGR